jgi:uncharacterized protein YqhQ
VSSEPRYMGGQAVLEGVMMRGADRWAVAVRRKDGSVEIADHVVPNWSERWRPVPIVRGVVSMAESLTLGYKALSWSANRQLADEFDDGDEEEQAPALSERAVGWTMAIAMVVFTGLFIVVPAVVIRGVTHRYTFLPFQFTEGVFRLVVFLVYIAAVSRLNDIRRVFQYHGAEHKAIAAYENGVELTPETAQQFTTAHVRCGTNFLLTVMVIAILVYSVVPAHGLALIIASRIVLIPLIAGLSFEVIRWSARNIDKRWVRALMRPGLALQRLTTREPTVDQLEVAIASLRAVMTAEQTAEVDRRAGVTVPVVAPAV